MSNLKLEVKNFKGTLNLPYRIEHEIRENYVVLSLYITFDDTVLCADCVTGTYSDRCKRRYYGGIEKGFR